MSAVMRSSIALNSALSSSIASPVLAHRHARVGAAGRDDVADGADQPVDRPQRRSRDDDAAGEAGEDDGDRDEERDGAEARQQLVAALGALADLEQRAVEQPHRRDFERWPARDPRERLIPGAVAAGERRDVEVGPLRRHAGEQRLGAAARRRARRARSCRSGSLFEIDGAGDGAEPAARVARRVLAQRRGDDLAIALARATPRAGRRSAATIASELTTNTTAYHDASRSPKRPLSGVGSAIGAGLGTSVGLEDIADAAHGVQQLRLEVAVDVLAQP